MDAAQRAAWEADGVFVVCNALSATQVLDLDALLEAHVALAEASGRTIYGNQRSPATGLLPVLAFAVPEDVNDDRYGGNELGSGMLSWGAPMLDLVACPTVHLANGLKSFKISLCRPLYFISG
jgi:hypothetical protein